MSDELLGALAPTTEASAAPSGAIAAREVAVEPMMAKRAALTEQSP